MAHAQTHFLYAFDKKDDCMFLSVKRKQWFYESIKMVRIL